jgi:hypothetical protein
MAIRPYQISGYFDFRALEQAIEIPIFSSRCVDYSLYIGLRLIRMRFIKDYYQLFALGLTWSEKSL